VLAQYGLGVQSLTQANYTAFLQDNFGSYAPQVEKQYPLSAFGSGGVAAAMTEIITDASYFCPAHRALNVAVQNNVPVWTYLYNHTSSCSWFGFLPAIFLNDLGATHTAEIPYVFGNVDFLPLPNGTCNMTSTERDISSTLISAWTAMAVNGNPSVDGGLQWPAFNSSSLGLNILNGTTVGTVDYSQCSFWDTVDTTVLNFTATTTNSTPASPSTTSSSVSSPSPSKNAASHSMAHPGSAFGLAAFVVYFGMLALL
jgi:carboxylesterase type B